MKNPTTENRIELNRTTAITRKETLAAKREKFQTTCENIDLSREGNKAWSLLKNLNGEQRKTNPQPILDEGETIADDQKRAERHNKYFASTKTIHYSFESYILNLSRSSSIIHHHL